jgi:hypothetical protein
MQFISIFLFIVCIGFRIFFYLEDYCTSDLCRHAFQLSIDIDEIRIEVAPYLIYNYSKILFYFADLFILYPAYKYIKDSTLAIIVIVWFIQPSYDCWALVPIIYIIACLRKYLLFAFAAIFLKFKIISLAYIIYLLNLLSIFRGRVSILRATFIFLAVIVVLSIVILSGNQLQVDHANYVGRENLFFRVLIYLASPVTSYISIDNNNELSSNIIRWQNFLISIFSFICIVRYRMMFFYILSAITIATVVDFIQIRYFLYLITIALILNYAFLKKMIKHNF